jgi:hypothetical protein
MIALICFVLAVLASPFKSKSRLEDENAVLRHQLIVLQRKVRGRAQLTNNDRWFFIQLYRWFPSILQVLTIIRPDTLVRWRRADFRRYWRWKSHPRGGRPQIETELRVLIPRMSFENPLWGAPRIHGELLKLGFKLAQSSVAKYMVKRRGPAKSGIKHLVTAVPTANQIRGVETSLEAVALCGASLLSDAFAPVPSPSERGFLDSSPQAEPSVQISRTGPPR